MAMSPSDLYMTAPRVTQESLFVHYKEWLIAAYQSGVCAPCGDLRVLNAVREYLLVDPGLHISLQNDAFKLIVGGLMMRDNMHSALDHLVVAFQFFEQAALHLYYYPWRKELFTIHTYSGHYVHVWQAALPQDGIFRALRRLGYLPHENGKILRLFSQHNAENLSMAAFGFLAGQIECQILSSILSSSGSGIFTVDDLLRERSRCRGELACIEDLRKLSLDVYPVPDLSGEQGFEEGATGEFHDLQTVTCYHCQEPWDMHVMGQCRKEAAISTTPSLLYSPEQTQAKTPNVDVVLHDCVFSDQCLEFHCAKCHTLHSPWCSVLGACKESRHHIKALSAKEKQDALQEEERNRFQLHSCLQPNHLPHYRCVSCKQLHYINCNLVTQCRTQGHRAIMIMLEKDQKLWLLRSTTDLTLLARRINTPATDGV
ncbi:Hypothetical predicted protein [Pelobates cultripes]|uniref:Spermatogenesis-associated protein 2 PUB-like domain-containing protein n=2 Tax=Pelobates cultripes TaxID=61616 RepID=A0AAD1TGZ4_PELCU|nr:Hypothetical predicted protein [Pelobates cultripes]